ncbi:MAG TPA: glycosyltransferase family 4 protein [Pyrinomonadaceae bacterium]|nr:glycosyltransferase family 4 protein [Pyrinomonadaceae bacterium]
MKSVRTLYVCYFGLREPLVQTQVLPYLREIAATGVEVYLLTFEPHLRREWDPKMLSDEQDRLANEGIKWSALAYHKRPSLPATLYDIAAGAWTIARLVRRHRLDVVHARAHVPMAMALLAARVTGCRLVFDIRGLMAEEYADAGVWAERSLKFRAVKMLERAGIRKADQVVVLTQAMREWLRESRLKSVENVEVIPCCVDFARYSEPNLEAGVEPDSFEVVYAGSVTGLYLLEEMAKFFSTLRKHEPRAFLRILTRSPQEAIARICDAGLTPANFWVGGVSASEVPHYLRRARLGLSFRKSTFSQLAASPTKIPEYLAAGLPVVSNAGIGDVDDLLKSERVGVVVNNFTVEEFERAALRALQLASENNVRARCLEVARRCFDVETIGANGYANVYRRLRSAAGHST